MDEVRTFLTPPKGGSKSEYVSFVYENRFKSNNL